MYHDTLDFLARISWAVLVAGFVIYFRLQIRDAFKKLVELSGRVREGPGGWKIDPIPTQSDVVQASPKPLGPGPSPSTQPDTTAGVAVSSSLPPSDTDSQRIDVIAALQSLAPMADPWAETIRQEAGKAPSADRWSTAREGVERLIQTSVALSHEQTYRQIFGTQIALLKRLHVSPLPLAAAATAEFEYHRQQLPKESAPTFDKWLAFLQHQALVTSDGVTLRITPRGESFLNYLHVQRISEVRAF